MARWVACLLLACGATHGPPDDETTPWGRATVDIGAAVVLDMQHARFERDTTTWPPPSTELTLVDRDAIRLQLPRMRSCYAAALARDERLQGAVDLVLRIDEDGAVSSIATTSCRDDICSDYTTDPPFPNSDVAACIASALRDAHFTPRPGRLIAPFDLSPTFRPL